MFISYLKEVKDDVKRNQYAEAIIEIMSQNTLDQKHNPQYRQKLWNHLHYIGNYELKLDIAHTVKKQVAPEKTTPKNMPYPKIKVKYRHYGKNIELIIEKAIEQKDPDLKNAYINSIASYMKLAYRNWNKENVSDEYIIKDLLELSGGKLIFDENNKITDLVQFTPKRHPHKSNKPHYLEKSLI